MFFFANFMFWSGYILDGINRNEVYIITFWKQLKLEFLSDIWGLQQWILRSGPMDISTYYLLDTYQCFGGKWLS
jgi:hypothetical protein